jgi:hypothetical protein
MKHRTIVLGFLVLIALGLSIAALVVSETKATTSLAVPDPVTSSSFQSIATVVFADHGEDLNLLTHLSPNSSTLIPANSVSTGDCWQLRISGTYISDDGIGDVKVTFTPNGSLQSQLMTTFTLANVSGVRAFAINAILVCGALNENLTLMVVSSTTQIASVSTLGGNTTTWDPTLTQNIGITWTSPNIDDITFNLIFWQKV